MSAATLIPISNGVADLLSPSQVGCFRSCEARWMYRYLIGLPDQGSPALALGTAVDTAIKASWHHKLEAGIDLPLETLIGIFAAKWLEESAKVEFAPKQDPLEMAKQGARMIEIYMAEAAPAIHPQAVDYEVRGMIAGVYVRGYIDLVEVDGTIVELKTAGRTPKEVPPDHAFQLATYAQLAKDLDLNGKARVDTLVKLKSPKLVRHSYEITLADYHYLRSSYPLVQEQMRSGLYGPNRNSWLCRKGTCAYWRRCEGEFGGTVPGGEVDE